MKRISLSRRSILLSLAGMLLLPLLLIGLYTLSIVWRVSLAEQEYFGRSDLIPLAFPARKFDQAAVPQSYGHKTFEFDSPCCGRIIVWRQKLNGFQHMYGSALACLELGSDLADKLFRLNEFAEFTFDWNSVEPSDLLDRKKDLANNALGRQKALEILKAKPAGNIAQAAAISCARTAESDPEFLGHYLDPRVLSLSEEQFGCHYLPKRNLFNYFRKNNVQQVAQSVAQPLVHASIEHTPSTWNQKEFLISYCCSAPPTEASMINAESQHFNLVPAWREVLDLAEKHHVKVMLEHGLLHPNTIHSPEKLKQLDELIRQVKNHPALEAYYIFDEPQENSFDDVAGLIEYIRKRDPAHLTFVNMLPIHGVPGKAGTDPSTTYLDFLRTYIKLAKPDLLSYDFYTFMRDRKSGLPYDLPGYFLNLSLMRQAAMEAHIPFMNIIQASTFLKEFRMPNENEMRWQVYTSLAYGARGISYFLYWGPKKFGGIYQDGKPTELLKPIVQLNKEIAALGPELMDRESIAVYQTAPLPAGVGDDMAGSAIQILSEGEFVIGLFGKRQDKPDCFMIVNRDYKQNSTVKFRAKTRIEQFDRDTTKWVELKSNSGEDYLITLPPGDGRLFKSSF